MVVFGKYYGKTIKGRTQMTRGFKRIVNIPKEDSEAADDAAMQKEYGDLATGWGMRRWYSFKRN